MRGPASFEAVEEIENTWIVAEDGCRLAARIWLPAAGSRPAPAILEYIPYRKRDFMRARDEPIHRYFAAHGYASVRVDVRGSGDSEGILTDEYTAEEQRDAVAIIAWIAAQPWSNGAVGMMGISWGGFNALQVAAHGPPALKAIITLCSTDDRYADDAHYMGGCLLNENMQWGSALMLYGALPPDPEIVGPRWRQTWEERLGALSPFPAVWMRHQRRDAYWRHGSVCEDFSAITCPVYAIGGWADGYSNAIPRLMANLECPRKALIGPWAHNFPHNGVPGPAIGFLQEALRWWDQWLLGVDTGIMDEPPIRVWMQESVAPWSQYPERPGRWVCEDEWPSPHIEARRWALNPARLDLRALEPVPLSFTTPLSTGLRAGEWCGFGIDGEAPRDQRPDDGGSLAFDGDPLTHRLEVLGAPVVELDLRCDRPVAMLAVRLGDIAPGGSVLRVSYGLLNLSHRDDHASPTPLEPGKWYRVRIALNDVAHAFPAGHRLRIAISTCYWPLAWPAPEPVVLTVRTGSSHLSLPVRAPREEDERLSPFPPPAWAPGPARRRSELSRRLEVDLITHEMVYTLQSGDGDPAGASLARLEDIDLELGHTMLRRHRVVENEPLSACTELTQAALLRRREWAVRVDLHTTLRATADAFEFEARLTAREGDERVREREWTETVPRDLI